MGWFHVVSIVAAVVAILTMGVYKWMTETDMLISHSSITCTDTSNPHKSVCHAANVCYGKNGSSHVITTFNTDNSTTDGLTGPVCYLIATDNFPQSAVYLRGLRDSTFSHTHLNHSNSYLFTRFKPDNLMHVLHDDVLPVLAVLMSSYPQLSPPYPVTLVFADGFGEMPYDEIYQSLSLNPLVYDSVDSHLCFSNLTLGSDRSTLWYQYGFSRPQGPVPHDREHIAQVIRTYTNQRLVAKTEKPLKYITVFTRRETRRITNEAQLIIHIAKLMKSPVKSVDLETHSIEEISDILSQSFLVVGMHGASLSMIIWLNSHTTLLELFPYAVSPERYTPYKTLAHILGVQYLSWSNRHMENTVGHPDYPPHLGGIDHLSAEKRMEITTETEVSTHLCCDDPSWLYHIYQDTHVHLGEITLLLQNVHPPDRE